MTVETKTLIELRAEAGEFIKRKGMELNAINLYKSVVIAGSESVDDYEVIAMTPGEYETLRDSNIMAMSL